MAERLKEKMCKEVTTYSDICDHRTTVRLYDVWDEEKCDGEYQIIKTWSAFPEDPCIWIFKDYGEALKTFKQVASETAGLC
jgi:hypothetical protein